MTEENNDIAMRNNASAPMAQPAPQRDEMMAMIELLAANPNTDIVKMQAAINMRNRELERLAEIAYTRAFIEMQTDLPTIIKKGEVFFNDKAKPAFKHAKFEDVIEAIKPILKAHGFSLQHLTRTSDKGVPTLRTVLRHVNGHSEFTERSAPADTSGAKNNLQAVGSTTSYLKRYNIFDLLGLAAKDEDNDGNQGQKDVFITEQQRCELQKLLEESGIDKVKFFRDYLKVEGLLTMPVAYYKKALNVVNDRIKKNANT